VEEEVVEVAGEVGAGERKPPADIGRSGIVVHGEDCSVFQHMKEEFRYEVIVG